MNEDVIDVLKQVRELLSDPERWTQGSNAKDKNDYVVPTNSPEACKWCLSGAIIKINPEYEFRCDSLLNPFIPSMLSMVAYNDSFSTTHKDIMKLLDDAIKFNEYDKNI